MDSPTPDDLHAVLDAGAEILDVTTDGRAAAVLVRQDRGSDMPGHWLTLLFRGEDGTWENVGGPSLDDAAGSGWASGTGIVGSIAYEFGDDRDRWIRVMWRPDDEVEPWSPNRIASARSAHPRAARSRR